MADEFFPELVGKHVDPDSGAEKFLGGDELAYLARSRYWLEAAYEEARAELSANEEVAKVSKYIQYICGQQWPSRGRPNYKASPVDNRVWRLFWELIATLTDIRPIFEVKESKKEYGQQAGMLNKVMKSWWLNSDGDLSLAMIMIYAILTTGYGKLTWNDELRQGEGDLEMVAIGPTDLLTLKPRLTLQSSQAVIYKSLMAVGWFRRKFGARGALVQPDTMYSRYSASSGGRPGHVSSMIYDALSPQMKHLVGESGKAQNSSYPVALYREFWLKDYTYNTSNTKVWMGRVRANWGYWVEPGKPLYPRGRLMCMGGPVILYDGPNPYWHGMFPFDVLRMNTVPWQFMGLSDIGPLIPLQDIINNILAGILDMVKKAVNPGFYGPKNAFSESMWESIDWSMPGMKAGFSPMVNQKPEFAPSPNLPSFVMNTLQLAAREMDQSSGIAAISELVRKKQVPAGDTLDKIKDAQQTPIRLKGRNTEIFLRGIGTQAISNVFQFYTAARRMTMLGSEGLTFEDFDWDPGTAIPQGVDPEKHARAFTFMIQPGSLLNANRIEEAMLYRALRIQGDLDRATFFKKLDVGLNVDTVERGLKREIAEGVSLHPPKPAKGGAPK
jgi:hypothetical protein